MDSENLKTNKSSTSQLNELLDLGENNNYTSQIESLKNQIDLNNKSILCLNAYINTLNKELGLIKGNLSWKVCESLQHFFKFVPIVMKKWGRRFLKLCWWIMTPKSIPARVSYFFDRYTTSNKNQSRVCKLCSRYFSKAKEKTKETEVKKIQNWCIVTVPHTLSIAELMAEELRRLNFKAEILQKMPANFSHDMYIVICPQMFKKLPPLSKLISYQMQQSVSSRWFSRKYFRTLKKSFAVLDYSITNLDFLIRKGVSFKNLYYLPVGASKTYKKSQEKVDQVLFYGDSLSCRRRQELLKALEGKFNLKVVNNLFGEKMKEEIAKSKLVINIHYYENALLETPRILECLSLGTPVLSESTNDVADYPELGSAVKFFQVGSEKEMIESLSEALENIDSLENGLSRAVERSNARFSYMFERFLIGKGILPKSALNQVNIYVPDNHEFLALSLPEVTTRRFYCSKIKPKGCGIFDGLRFSPGWVGCASNYKLLSKYALDRGIDRLTIMEDDVVFKENFQEQFKIVNEYLDSYSGNWDIFSGLIADLHPETQILSVDSFKGMMFVTVNKMTSSVFNIYNKCGLEKISGWCEDNSDPITNTFDRYLENYDGIRVIVALPYIVEHSEAFDSVIWGFPSGQYSSMISKSHLRLFEKVAEFLLCKAQE